jgi:CO/xanthine dehydrogenase FAD-binding subunit
MYVATNTHILVPEFEYVQPSSLEDVFSHLSEHREQARLIAGGTDLLVQMKMGRVAPTFLISLARIQELQGFTSNKESGGLTVGATTSIRNVARSELVRQRYTALAEACDAFSTVPIMIMATLGGNVCNASPAADAAVALLAFDAGLDLASREGRRVVSLNEFLRGPGQTALREGEILHSVVLPSTVDGSGSTFVKISRVAADISKVCAAVKLVRDRDRVVECRIALGAVAPTPMRARGAEARLMDRPFDLEGAEEAARIAREEVKPISDVRATREYRSHVSRVVVRDALLSAWHRSGGGSVK